MITASPRVVVVAYNELGHRVGETHHNARISDAIVDRIRELHEDEGYGYLAICKELNISLTAVRKICTYERRAQTPVRWKRLKLVPQKANVIPIRIDPSKVEEVTRIHLPIRRCFSRFRSPQFLALQMCFGFVIPVAQA